MDLKIHVYTIAKNEERFCERWVKSCVGAAGMHVLDTGSTDGTVELLKRLGVNVRQASFTPWKTIEEYDAIAAHGAQPFRFDVPRNTNLDMIPDDADVCIQVDMDEVLVDGWIDIIQKNWRKDTTRLDYIYAWSMNGDTPLHQFHYNKCHARHGCHWIKPVHEILWPKGDFKECFSNCNTLLVKHYPDNKDRSSYLPLLELSRREDPHDSMNSFNLAREYTFHNIWKLAIDEVVRYLGLPKSTWGLERCCACLLAAKSCAALGSVKDQEKWLLRAVSEDPQQREGWCGLADHYRLTGQNEGGYFAAKKALSITVNPLTHYNVKEVWSDQPHDIAAVCGFYSGFREESLRQAWLAMKANPFDDRLMVNYELIHKQVEPASDPHSDSVDVIILSWAKDEAHYKMTERCISNLRLSSRGVSLHIVVVETNKNISSESFSNKILFGEGVSVVIPDEPFGYNRYLQIAYKHLASSASKFVMILNNDVVLFNPEFMCRMMSHMDSFSSVSPLGLREAKWGRIDETKNVHPGYDLNLLIGWCLLIDKAIFNAIPFEYMFPSIFKFYCQDEHYSSMLQRNGFKHALVCDAQALHLQCQTHCLLGADELNRFTKSRNALMLDADRNKPSNNIKVYDCFTFWRELDTLELRLNTLDSVVDKFVLVESTKTHAGKDKPLLFSRNKQRFMKFLHKIEHVVVDDMPDGDDRWARENFQRNAIMRGLLGANDNDVVMISDVDEIPRPEIVFAKRTGFAFRQDMYCYYYNLRNAVENWIGTVSVAYSDLKFKDPQAFRNERHNMLALDDSGWHFSWIGDADAARDKVEAFAHSEFDTDEVKSKLYERLDGRGDFAGRHGKKFVVAEVREPALPRYIVDHKNDLRIVPFTPPV